MPYTLEFSDARRALLEEYLRGELPQTTRARGASPQRALVSHAPLSFGQQQMWLLDDAAGETFKFFYNEKDSQ